MAQPQHITQGNPEDANSPSNAETRPITNRKARRPRTRGCGVPPTVWFAPHPDNSATDTADSAYPANSHESGRGRDWAVDELVRQFTAAGQHYSLIRIPAFDGVDDPVLAGALTRRRRTTAESQPDRDAESLIRSGYDLVAILAADGEPARRDDANADRLDDDIEADREHHDWPPMPDGMTVDVLIKGARRMLADGGTLAVLLPRTDPGPGFRDGTGRVIAAARRAGFAYLQHIALVDAYIDDEGITPTLPPAVLDAFWSARAAGVPVHARAHSDLLILRKPAKENTLA